MKWLIVLLLAGCAATKQKVYEADYCDGCCFHIKKMSSEEASEIEQEWLINGCKVHQTEKDQE
jgi:hypothetical protein